MPRLLVLFSILSLLPFAAAAPKKRLSRAARVEKAIAGSPVLRRAHVGVRLADLSGKVLYERNARHWFVPASNTKLYTTAMALTRLGSDYRMATRVTAETAPDAGGVIRGDIRLVGAADPTISGRNYPYEKDKDWQDAPPAGIEDLAAQLARRGVRRIDGAVVGDDTAFLWDPFPDGWSIDDPLYEYGAPVSALTVQDNAMRLEVRPGAAGGGAPELYLYPDAGQVTLIPSVETVEPGQPWKIRLERPANTAELRVYGSIAAGAKPYSALLAVPDPALYAAHLLTDALARHGIAVRDAPRARHRTAGEDMGPEWPAVLAEIQSRPLSEIVQVVNKVSQNLHAELLLRETGRKEKPFGSREAGLEALEEFLTAQAGLDKDDVHFQDGSGLSRLTLLTPEATSKLLLFMAAGGERDAWFASLPAGGEDGTLSRRFQGAALRGKVRAKTGTLSHVSALGGYLHHRKLGTLAFTVLVNNYNSPAAEARAGIDKLVEALLE